MSKLSLICVSRICKLWINVPEEEYKALECVQNLAEQANSENQTTRCESFFNIQLNLNINIMLNHWNAESLNT